VSAVSTTFLALIKTQMSDSSVTVFHRVVLELLEFREVPDQWDPREKRENLAHRVLMVFLSV